MQALWSWTAYQSGRLLGVWTEGRGLEAKCGWCTVDSGPWLRFGLCTLSTPSSSAGLCKRRTVKTHNVQLTHSVVQADGWVELWKFQGGESGAKLKDFK